ncbi:hypothetical protein AB838_00530 [Rhodobacteraceae bacterium (ex Bugula neritina AB1)]|nr:hypothetical protein AB838_00530 [Rhodobacteraceae bacterium (ex Bugula neritina AB1)]
MSQRKVWKRDQAFHRCRIKCYDTLDFAVTVGFWFVGANVLNDVRCFMHSNVGRDFRWYDSSQQEHRQPDQCETKE